MRVTCGIRSLIIFVSVGARYIPAYITENTVNKCRQCKFWNPHHDNLDDPDLEGACHRYPPVFNPDTKEEDVYAYDDFRFWSHPVTLVDNWCGEFNQLEFSNE